MCKNQKAPLIANTYYEHHMLFLQISYNIMLQLKMIFINQISNPDNNGSMISNYKVTVTSDTDT